MIYFPQLNPYIEEIHMKNTQYTSDNIISTQQTPVPDGQVNNMRDTTSDPLIAPGDVEEELNIDEYIDDTPEKQGLPIAAWVFFNLLMVAVMIGLLIYVFTRLFGGGSYINENSSPLTTVEETAVVEQQ